LISEDAPLFFFLLRMRVGGPNLIRTALDQESISFLLFFFFFGSTVITASHRELPPPPPLLFSKDGTGGRKRKRRRSGFSSFFFFFSPLPQNRISSSCIRIRSREMLRGALPLSSPPSFPGVIFQSKPPSSSSIRRFRQCDPRQDVRENRRVRVSFFSSFFSLSFASWKVEEVVVVPPPLSPSPHPHGSQNFPPERDRVDVLPFSPLPPCWA